MSTDPRHLFLHDEFDDFAYDHSFRIPPLQEPFPYLPYERPPALEPNAHVNGGASTTKLTTRRKALAEAKPIGEDEPRISYDNVDDVQGQMTAIGTEGSRKRQKLDGNGRTMDFVQLPKPMAKARVERPPPFKPVPILNELHEPPPSAALFPPITPSTPQESGDNSSRGNCLRSVASKRRGKRSVAATASSPERETEEPKRRIRLRTRRNWTPQETVFLLEGVEIYGAGKWKKILNHGGFEFHPERTTVDLKDRYRTWRLIQDKASGSQPDKPAHINQGIPLPSVENTQERGVRANPKMKKKDGSSPAPRKLAHPWTKEEDVGLAKGYRKYGFQWTIISQDPEFGLHNRTGKQVRDRFRIKFPAHYQSSIPIPLTEKEKQKTKANAEEPMAKAPAGRLKESSQSVSEASFHTAPRAAGTVAETTSDHGLWSVTKRLEDEEKQISADARNSPSERSRQSSIVGDERGHLGIPGLLNDEEEEYEQVGRLPAVKFPFDDWQDENGAASSVILPPLLWEDMATRPMFELE